ncbi:MAG: protein kinase [Dethiobacter sp.]|jgi:serine/threonine-protein kinase|nr:protein kinase [Dethiobacter sp.]
MIGKILGNRYRVVEKIGDGGTAFVYRGLDILLNRSVTVKVLRPEYVSDQDFVRRFRREAQAAASLSHPNIVSIYDVGYEDGIHYIVMEYIKGKSLKELVEQMGQLPLKMAVDYACQIAHALDHAHRHGIIHRDVKPHNILINEEGRVKVTDFGIAQAVTSTTVTYDGAILGSVHYFSPEQARGGQTGEKSDIYSLGVVLYEMLTGAVPYEGESPVSIALKHVQDPFPDPRTINADIPVPLWQVIRKAVEKDPERRYQSAREILSDLTDWLNGKPISPVSSKPPEEKARPEKKKKRKALIWRWVIIVLLLAFAVLLTVGISHLRSIMVVPEVEVPSVEGESISRATKILGDVGLKPKIVDEAPDETIPSGHVLRQDPAAGRRVKQTREIELTLSTGPIMVEVPSVLNRTELEATIILRGLGFNPETREEYREEAPGTVVRQDPSEGFSLVRGSTVIITVSLGGRPFPMKNLIGSTLADAEDWAALFGLTVRNVAHRENPNVAPGFVYEQFPAAGELVQAGDFVDLVVSKERSGGDTREYGITIDTAQIPVGETVTVTIKDLNGERVEFHQSSGGTFIVTGVGHGTVEVRWRDYYKKINFPN